MLTQSNYKRAVNEAEPGRKAVGGGLANSPRLSQLLCLYSDPCLKDRARRSVVENAAVEMVIETSHLT